MPNYYNPYNFYPASYTPQQPVMNYPQPQQQSYASGQPKAWEWVEGEIGAKAYQMPPGWPANQPIALWDSTEQFIWIKSWNQMGIPNPMQKLKYTMENPPMLPQGQSGAQSGHTEPAPQYVTKEDFDAKLNEIKDLLKNQQSGQNNQNGNGNRGGNR